MRRRWQRQAARVAPSVFVAGGLRRGRRIPREAAAAFRPYDAPVDGVRDAAGCVRGGGGGGWDRGTVVAFGALAFVAAVREWVLGIEWRVTAGCHAGKLARGA